MYIYNVTLKVDTEIADEWLQWMRKVHIPDVMATGYFAGHRLSRLLDDGELDGITFVVQYNVNDIDQFLTYQQLSAPALQKEHSEKFVNKVVAFRTVMELLDEA